MKKMCAKTSKNTDDLQKRPSLLGKVFFICLMLCGLVRLSPVFQHIQEAFACPLPNAQLFWLVFQRCVTFLLA